MPGNEPGGAPVLGNKAVHPPPPRPALRGLRDGLEAVFAEGGEIDQKIGGVGESGAQFSASSIHAGEPMSRGGQKRSFAGVLASQARTASFRGDDVRVVVTSC